MSAKHRSLIVHGPPPDDAAVVTITQAAQMLRVHIGKLVRYIMRGQLRAWKYQRTLFVRKADVRRIRYKTLPAAVRLWPGPRREPIATQGTLPNSNGEGVSQ